MAIDHMDQEGSSQTSPPASKTSIHAYWTFIAASIVSSVGIVSAVVLLAMMFHQYGDFSAVFGVPSQLLSAQIVFWLALALGVVGVVFWAAMVRQKSLNELRLATIKLELAEMALRSEQRLKARST